MSAVYRVRILAHGSCGATPCADAQLLDGTVGPLPRSALYLARLRQRTGHTSAKVFIYDTHCRSFDARHRVDIKTLQPNDPRFKPCIPTTNSIGIAWMTPPTQAQQLAVTRILGELAQNHPTMPVAQAIAAIRAALRAVH